MGKYTWLIILLLLVSAVLIGKRIQIHERSPSTAFISGSEKKDLAANLNVQRGSGDLKRTPSIGSANDNSGNQKEDPVFRLWIKEEAKNLDSPKVNAEQKRQEIQKVVANLSPTQSRLLLATAKNPRAPAGEKILSTYLLVEGGHLSREELKEFIASPMAEQGHHEPHTEAELIGVREKSLRIMAIDGLFSRAQRDTNAREALAKVISDIQDPYVKAYAKEKLEQLSRQ